MKSHIAISLTLLVSMFATGRTTAAPTSQPTGSTEWKPIFNARDLTGWYTYLKGQGINNDPTHIFQVDDAMIHIYKDADEGSAQPFGYIASNDDFGDCRLRFQYKWGTKRFGSRSKSRR